MFKLTKVGIATALGLALCLSIFTSGAFAQSINQTGVAPSNQAVQNTWNGGYPGHNLPVNYHGGSRAPGNGWQGGCGPQTNCRGQGNGWQGNGWQSGCGLHSNCRGHGVNTKCIRVTKWVRSWHHMRRETRLVCRRW